MDDSGERLGPKASEGEMRKRRLGGRGLSLRVGRAKCYNGGGYVFGPDRYPFRHCR